MIGFKCLSSALAVFASFVSIFACPRYVASSEPAAESVVALINAHIVTVRARGELAVLSGGAVLIRDGRIEAVGETLATPPGAEEIDLKGSWLLPGFVDAHYLPAVFFGEANEYTDAVTEDFDPLVAFDPWDPELKRLHSLGVTTLAVSPGDRNVVGGSVRLVKTVCDAYPLVAVDTPPSFKTSLGRATLGGPGLPRYPTALSGAVRLLSEWIELHGRPPAPQVASGKVAVATAGESQSSAGQATALPKPERILIHVETRSQAERLAGHFRGKSLVPVLVHGERIDAQGWSRLGEHAPIYSHAIVGPLGLSSSTRALEVPAALERQGTTFAFATDGQRFDLLTSAVLAVRRGLSRQAALASLTVNAARIYGVEDRLGRIEPGCAADLVAWSGDPLSLCARVERVWIDGRTVYQGVSE